VPGEEDVLVLELWIAASSTPMVLGADASLSTERRMSTVR